MPEISYEPSEPALTRRPDGLWIVEWPRSAEISVVSKFLGDDRVARISVVDGADSVGFSSIVNGVAKELSRDVLAGPSYCESMHFIPILITADFCSRTGLFPVQSGLELIKYTSGARIFRYAPHARLRSLSNFIHRQRRASAPVTLRAALNYIRMRPAYESADLDVELNGQFLSQKNPRQTFSRSLEYDIARCPDIDKFIEKSIIALPNLVTRLRRDWLDFSGVSSGLKVVCQRYSSASEMDRGVIVESGSSMEVGLKLLTEEELVSFCRPIVDKIGNLDADVVIERAIKGNLFRGKFGRSRSFGFGDDAISRIVMSLQDTGRESLEVADLRPSSAPVDAVVVDGVLSLSGLVDAKSNTALDQLEELRKEHLREVDRIRSQLAGSNAGDGFLSRLQATSKRLADPLTEAGALVLATQVRALEDMLPAVRDVLTDVTAADVGATISALGLYVRQFQTWKKFLSEAEGVPELESDVFEALLSLTNIVISDESGNVGHDLKSNLIDVRDASVSTSDSELQHGLSNSTNNSFKAIARYIRELMAEFGGKYSESVSNKVAERLSEITLAGLMLAGGGYLVQLANNLPEQYGWAYGILIWLSVHMVDGKNRP